MYISRVKLNLQSQHTREAMKNPNVFHGAISSITPNSLNGQRIRSLWRVENGNLLLVTPFQPDLSSLKEQFGSGSAETKCYDNFLSQIAAGQNFYFHMKANPIVLGKRSPKRHAATRFEDIARWLQRMGERHGFVPDLSNTIVNDVGFEVAVKANGFTVIYGKALFDGLLMVTDADAFRNALMYGIGHEKAYGCGLMSVIPVGRGKEAANGKL